MSKTLSPPTSRPPRVSVPVTAEVLQVFERLAKAGNMSTGRAIAEWLSDTTDAAEFMATTLEKARAAPKLVARELHAYALGLTDETGDLIERVRSLKRGAWGEASGLSAGPTTPPAPIPPSCNTGGKVPPTKPAPRGGKSS